MIKKILLIFLFIFSLSSVSLAEKHCFDDFCFSKKVEELNYYNHATFKFLFFRVYSIALYAPKITNIYDISEEQYEKSLTFYFHRDVDKNALIKGAKDVLVDNPTVSYNSYKKEINKLNKFIRDIYEGDSFTITHKPKVGISLIYQGQTVATIKNSKFSNDYFSIWLSQWSVSNRLRQDLFLNDFN